MLLLRNDCSPGVKRRKNSDWPKQCSTVHVMKLCFMIFFLFPRQYCAQSIGQRFLLKSGRIQILICYLFYKCAFVPAGWVGLPVDWRAAGQLSCPHPRQQDWPARRSRRRRAQVGSYSTMSSSSATRLTGPGAAGEDELRLDCFR